MVNVVGFLSIQRLTTNVTGHFAFFVDEVFKLHFFQGFTFFLYIFFFFAGSFVSSFLVEFIYKRKESHIYVIPVLLEAIILFSVALLGERLIFEYPDSLAFLLLFAMGLQNSLVTTISNAAVRTTHLTGLFTDLGIELSQLLFYKQQEQRHKLYASIKLRFTIISFFFMGGIAGGILYSMVQFYALLVGGVVLVFGTTFDYIKFRMVLTRRARNKVYPGYGKPRL